MAALATRFLVYWSYRVRFPAETHQLVARISTVQATASDIKKHVFFAPFFFVKKNMFFFSLFF